MKEWRGTLSKDILILKLVAVGNALCQSRTCKVEELDTEDSRGYNLHVHVLIHEGVE
jgi:hypothetical protein